MDQQTEVNEVVDLVHSLVLQSRPPPSSGFDDISTTSRLKIKSVPSSPCNLSRANTIPVRKKVEIKSAPLKPPDITNSSLFPSVEETSTPPPRRIQLKPTTPSSDAISPSNLSDKLKTLEAKLTQPRRASLPVSDEIVPAATLTPSRKTPRSAKLFNELSSERRLQLDKLAAKYSSSIDANNCRNILDEMEFLFQLFNTSSITSQRPDGGIPLLSSAAEQAYFAIKVVISQLDSLFISLPPFILQLIIDNYPHKIPKPVRKHIEDWLEKRSGSIRPPIISPGLPSDPFKTVTFRSETDGRSNFLQQQDFHAFCKQRDLFYSIRETWTMNPTPTPVIFDRRQARMSFPPPAPGGNTGQTLQFKVQSLFQMNSSPTNLFHMASLFVSHYILEQRALEVGGLPKDDHMKEFFQSNPEKLLQLNSRFAGSEQASETENVAPMAFQKQFLLAASPKFVVHLVDRLVLDILEKERSEETLTGGPELICRQIKDTVYLARLLGFANFLGYLPDETKVSSGATINSIEREMVLQEQVKVRKYHRPPLDLEGLLEEAKDKGRITGTILWVVEFLLQCDPITLQLPGYQKVLQSLVGIYKSCKVGGVLGGVITDGNRNLIRFQLGVLFSAKIFPDKVFMLVKSIQDTTKVGDGGEGGKGVDAEDLVATSLVEFFFQETFKRFRRTLSWGKLEVSHPAITGEFRHIRPIPASGPQDTKKVTVLTTLTKEKQLQTQMESTFFEQYPPVVKRSVDFVAERMAANFMTVAKMELFPNFRTVLQNQGLSGVRAAEKCRARLMEDMNKYLTERCSVAVKLFLDPNVTPGVLAICQKIATRKGKETGGEWIKNFISPAMFPDIVPALSEEASLASAIPQVKPPPPEDPPFEVLILIHRTLRKLHSSKRVDPQYIDKILTCPSLSQSPYILNPLIDWGLAVITFQPSCLNTLRIRQLVSLWKSLWTTTSSSKILNPRNLILLSKSPNSRDSWINLGNVTQQLISENLISPSDLERQCMTLLREDWPDPVHKRISEFLTIVLESFHERREYQGSDSAQVLDWMAWLCSGQPDQD